MIKQTLDWIYKNRVGMFIGAVVGFIGAKWIAYPTSEGGRQATAELSRMVGPIDSLLSAYEPEMIVFIKVAIVMIFIGAIIGGFVDSKVD